MYNYFAALSPIDQPLLLDKKEPQRGKRKEKRDRKKSKSAEKGLQFNDQQLDSFFKMIILFKMM